MKFLILNQQSNLMPNVVCNTKKCDDKFVQWDPEPCTKGGGHNYTCGINKPSINYPVLYC